MDRITLLLGAHEGWERPGPTPSQRRTDIVIALAVFALAALSIELMRSLTAFEDASSWGDILRQHGAAASLAVLLIWRRSHPMLVASLASLHLYVIGAVEPIVASSLVMQSAYFFAIFSAVAWARDRRVLAYLLAAFLVIMALWLAWMFALTSGLQEMYDALGVEGTGGSGIFSLPVAAVAWTTLINLLFLGGAILLGQVAWRGALHTARDLEHAETIRAQTARLRDQAVVAERLRIARELHDVVAHHVSVMGVQAAAARRVLTKNPDAARESLGAIEGASRSAVSQMRDLLGTLRSGELAADATLESLAAGASASTGLTPTTGRAPQPDLSDLPELVELSNTPTCEVTYALVEEDAGGAGAVPAALQLTAYRIVQESLANVRRHSTATRASVVVRVGDHVEVEVLDNGAPRHGTSGTGLGQKGIRERAALLGGEAEVGPRRGAGYRVRVTLPLSTSRPEQLEVAP